MITTALGQDSNYKLLPESTMTITGTSTIHDWECDVETIKLNADFSEQAFGETAPAPGSADFINNLTVTVPVKSIKSGKSGMNNKIYDALKEKKHPNIKYVFKKAELTTSDDNAESFVLNATGELTVAGNTRTVSFPVQGVMESGDTVRFEGSYSLNMKDYDVEPPSAVFGTIKSGEKVTISFDVKIANQAVAGSEFDEHHKKA